MAADESQGRTAVVRQVNAGKPMAPAMNKAS
jgi:hypothetical protein